MCDCDGRMYVCDACHDGDIIMKLKDQMGADWDTLSAARGAVVRAAKAEAENHQRRAEIGEGCKCELCSNVRALARLEKL